MSPYLISKDEHDLPQIDLKEFEVTEHGFLPAGQPLARLSSPYYTPWEDLAVKIPQLIQTRTIREEIQQLPILSTAKLHREEEWRRAYVLLAFLTHAHIWGGTQPEEVCRAETLRLQALVNSCDRYFHPASQFPLQKYRSTSSCLQ